MPNRNKEGGNLNDLQQSESIMLRAIDNYFSMIWSRFYTRAEENRYAVRVLSLILTSIKSKKLPESFNITNYIPAQQFISNQPLSRTLLEGYFSDVADYLQDKMMHTDAARLQEYITLTEGLK